ncbi:hypothetical protein GALL_366830 [mine drainage metagenome]|uniref:DUF4186 domain-containing protein n=1 Tax=mine drainage metagenome TaxID=410659 RepID=A0A1J5QNK9_9ZZZZ
MTLMALTRDVKFTGHDMDHPDLPQHMRNLDELFAGLARSAFRRSFHLAGKDLAYLRDKGLPAVLAHAEDFITKRLAPAVIPNDGKQTPFRGHPAFVAQHATACCCRGCLEKWHRIPPGRELTPEEAAYVRTVLERWLRTEMARA